MTDQEPRFAKRICELLAALLDIPSPAGMCREVSSYVEDRLVSLGLTVLRKHDGALACVIEGRSCEAPAAGFVAHLDTLGAQVKQLKDNGRLRLVPVGTWSSRFAEGARVKIHTSENVLTGTILPVKASGHAFGKKVDDLPVSWDNVELRIDADTTNREETEELGIGVGDFVSIDPQAEFIDNGYLVSRFLDDKAAVAALLVAAERLVSGGKPPRDIHLMFTVSEEIGTGAPSIVDPKIGDLIALDIASVAPGQESREDALTVAMADHSGPYDRQLSLEMIAACEAASIPVCRDIFRYYKSDLFSARMAGADARMALMTFGVDASHGYERTHVTSLDALARFIIAFAGRVPK